MDYETITHTFEPIFNNKSKILILGSLPSVKSRENCFYYGNPHNRFWKVVSAVLEVNEPITIEDKKEMLLNYNIALWDVISKCNIIGSSDSTIKNVILNDLSIILNNAPIKKIFANGNKAYELYNKYLLPIIGREIIKLPSTSPANAKFKIEQLKVEWLKIL